MKVINYFIRLAIIIFVVIIAKSSTDIRSAAVENDNVNKTINLSTMAMKVVEVEQAMKFNAVDTYTGDLTGYAANCPLCSGKLACLPTYNVMNGTNTYNDMEYGKVYIVASSKNLACGSIISFYSNRIGEGKILAIVLDRGVKGNAIDFLSTSEKYASDNIGRSSITYDVLRNGWA